MQGTCGTEFSWKDALDANDFVAELEEENLELASPSQFLPSDDVVLDDSPQLIRILSVGMYGGEVCSAAAEWTRQKKGMIKQRVVKVAIGKYELLDKLGNGQKGKNLKTING